MTNRLFRRSRGTDSRPPALLPGLTIEQHPIDVRLYTADGSGDVQVLAGSGRITELLNSSEPIQLRADPSASDGGETAWIEVDVPGRDEILLVVPPPRDANPLQRLHRPAQDISMRIGPYLVTGEAHVPPGAEAVGFLQRHRPHFVPLTRARIHSPWEPEQTVSVAIVNLWMAEAISAASLAEPEGSPQPAPAAPEEGMDPRDEPMIPEPSGGAD